MKQSQPQPVNMPAVVLSERMRPHVWIAILLVGLTLMYFPVFQTFLETVWAADDQGHGPIVMAVSAWLIWYQRREFAALTSRPNWPAAAAFLAFGLFVYIAGRNQMYDTFEALSLIFILFGLVLGLKGWPAVRLLIFPLLFLCFMVPLPSFIVQTLTTPLKIAVSYVAEWVLRVFDLPVARSGVILFVGPYQLLVADACSGLNSLFTLESLGLFYMNLMGYKSKVRNVLLVVLIVPISFCANVCRVMILILVTYYLGDEAGQGFLHSLAGMTLFLVALVLLLATDGLLGKWLPKEKSLPNVGDAVAAAGSEKPAA
jgi:exosortase B